MKNKLWKFILEKPPSSSSGIVFNKSRVYWILATPVPGTLLLYKFYLIDTNEIHWTPLYGGAIVRLQWGLEHAAHLSGGTSVEIEEMDRLTALIEYGIEV